MDIKQRIDGLTETEAKAALQWYANQLPVWLECKYCYCRYCRVRDSNSGYEKCVENILKHSLKEARK